jgi:hypothetical protein
LPLIIGRILLTTAKLLILGVQVRVTQPAQGQNQAQIIAIQQEVHLGQLISALAKLRPQKDALVLGHPSKSYNQVGSYSGPFIADIASVEQGLDKI